MNNTAGINHTPRTTPGPRRRWFGEGELKCQAAGCGRPIPAGYYGKTKSTYLCSAACSRRFSLNRGKTVKCTFCGKRYKRQHTMHTRPFCKEEHYYLWRRKQTDETRSGQFAPLLYEFLEDCVPRFLAPASINSIRCNLSTFFYFLRQRKIRSLERVNPKAITAFLVDLRKTRKKSAGRICGNVRLFFDWMIISGKRKAANPVIPRFHTQTNVSRLPRPYESQEIQLIRSLVEGSGDPTLQLAIAIGEESGLRISEVCNLRISDVDLEKQQFFVRLPNKTKTERFTPFHTRTKDALVAWLKKRPSVDHDFLITGTKDIPLRKHTLRLRLNRLLCGPGKLDKFSFHRLRHTAASKVYPIMDSLGIMTTFGWKSEKVMQGYTRLLPENLRESYTRAMDEVARGDTATTLQPESIEAYFAADTSAK